MGDLARIDKIDYKNSVSVVASPLPFSNKQIEALADEGDTLEEIINKLCPGQLKKAGFGAIVSINGYEIKKKYWHLVRPKNGTLVNVRIIPQGGGGGKNPITALLSIAVLVAAPYLGAVYGAALGASIGVSTAVGTALVTAGVSIVGQMLVSALAPPPRPSNAGVISNPSESPTQFIEGASNALNPYGVVPICLGVNRMFPLQAARPYTESQNNDQYVRQLFTYGYGTNMSISDLKLGETPLSEFTSYEIEHRLQGDLHLPLNLYSNDVAQDDYSVLLESVAGYTLRTTRTMVDEAIVDFTLPRGLAQYNDQGQRIASRVQVEVQYSPAGLNQWSPGVSSFYAVPQKTVDIQYIPTQFLVPNMGLSGVSYTRNLVVIDIFTTEVTIIHGSPYPTAESAVAPPLPETKARLSTILLKTRFNPGSVIPPVPPQSPTYPTEIISYTDDRQPSLFGVTFGSSTDFIVSTAGVWGGGIGGLNPLRVVVAAGSITAKVFDITASQTEAIRQSVRIVFPSVGTYDIRVRRTTPDTNSDQIFDSTYLSAIKSIKYRTPINLPGLCGTALRIKATDQLNGVVDQLNAIVSNAVPDYDPDIDDWVMRVTSNPASLYRYVWQGAANERALPDNKIDLDSFKEWWIYCNEKGYTYNRVIDYDTSIDDISRDIASAGSASPAIVDGKRTIVVDKQKDVISQIVTPRNSRGYTGEMIYPDMPHAFRVQFRNAEKGYQQDERIVYDDGYDESNATKFENLEVQSCTNAILAFKIGRRLLATARLRPEKHTFTQDVEHISFLRGDRIKLEHDVPIIGVGDGRIKQVFTDGTNVTGIEIDDTISIPKNGTFYTRIRFEDQTFIYKELVTSIGSFKEFNFVEPFPIIDTPEVGDLMYIVEAGGELDLIVHKVEPGADLSAVITAFDYAPAIFDAETGIIPNFNSNITTPLEFIRPVPPILLTAQSDEAAMIVNTDGTYTSRAIFTLQNDNDGEIITEIKLRRSGDSIFTNANVLEATPERVILTGLNDAARYDIQIRYRRAGSSIYSLPLQINSYLFVGASGLPDDVTGFLINVTGENALLKWDQNDDIDLSHYIIKFSSLFTGATWGTSQILETKVLENRITIPFQPGTYLIKAVDLSGNESENATAIITYNPAQVANAVEVINEHPIFLGIKDNIFFDGSGIQLADPTIPIGYYYFNNMVDLTSIFTSFVSASIVANGIFFNNIFTMDDIFSVDDIFGSGNNDIFTMDDIFSVDDIFGIGVDAWDVFLEFSVTQDDPEDTGALWSEWAEFQAGNIEFRAIRFRIRLRSFQEGISPRVSLLSVTVDMPDRIERYEDLFVPSTGVVVTYDTPFKSNPAIAITTQDGDAADEYHYIYKNSSGFSFHIYNKISLSYVDRICDTISSGYGRES